MSDPVQNFEFVLKKQTSKCSVSLYSDIKQHNKHRIKPQDVISSVSMQLKAIQVADSVKIEKCIRKDLQNLKKCNFLSVNKLPVYEEVRKPSTRFDTQCVTDTQLINIIEDAEIIDNHRGMTQEFETSFCHYTEKNEEDDEETNVAKEDTQKNTEIMEGGSKIVINVDKNNEKENENKDVCSDTEDIKISTDIKTKNKSINKTEVVSSDKVCKPFNVVSRSIDDKEIITDKAEPDSLKIKCIENNIDTDNSFSIISPIMCHRKRGNEPNSQVVLINDNSNTSHDKTNTEEMYSQILNQYTQVENDAEDIKRPVSPIFMQNNVKLKSKSPSPLIFNLDKFEQFEKIAIPIIETNDLKTAKRVINSQILDKELLLKIDEKIILNNREVLSPVLQDNLMEARVDSETEFKSHKVKDPDLNTAIELIELDKATSDDLISKVIKEKVEVESNILKDEILFSSDEDESYVHKDYQNLPFTCALETSFDEESDILDKTMYVGFQTASNKTIQIFTESFAQAKSLLSEGANDEVTVTDLVQNCDSAMKNVTQDKQAKIDCGDVEKELDFGLKHRKDVLIGSKENNDCKINKSSSFKGFMTANNKEIKLSDRALARCKKVFQDIDFNEKFTEIDKAENSVNYIEKKNPNSKTTITNNIVDDDIQNIDDVIIQEFENIEMSLEENKHTEKENVASLEFRTASNKDIQITETALLKIKEVFKDIDFNEDLNEAVLKDINEKNNALPKTAKDQQNINKTSVSITTTSDKKMDISKEALAETEYIFQDIDSIELQKKHQNKGNPNNNLNNLDHSTTAFVGFKTANNKDIKVSDQALAKTYLFFKDIDSEDFKFLKKNSSLETCEDDIYNQPSTSKSHFLGFKTANNTNIDISKEAFAKTKDVFKEIDSTDVQVTTELLKSVDFNQPLTNETGFVGFKTANNKEIKISNAALTKSKDIFRDIDSNDFNFGDRNDRNSKNETIDVNVKSTLKSSFAGFKTANNKEIKISDKSLAKTKNIFKDIDSDDFKFPLKVNERKGNNNENKMDVLNQPPSSKENFTGFKTANNKEIVISKEALVKTKSIFEDIDSADFKFPEKVNKEVDKKINEVTTSHVLEMMDQNQPSISKAMFVGFQTANNKKISISKESLAKTKTLFQDIDSNDFAFPKKGMNKESPDIGDSLHFESKSSFTGFKTANHKLIEISETALAKTKNIFQNINSTEFLPPKDHLDIKIDNIVAEDTGIAEKPSEAKIPKFQGFQTASNKQVKVSSEALLKSRKMLQNNDTINNFKDKIEDEDIFYTDNKYKNEKDSLHDKKTVVGTKNNITNDNASGKTSPVFKGFQTANKKPVVVSKEALTHSKKLFQDIEIPPNDIEPAFYGFKTANEGKVTVSEDSLAKSRKIFQNLDLSQNLEKTAHDSGKKTSDFKFGFKTGTNKDVLISEEAIARTKRRFSEIDDSNDLYKKKDKIATKEIDDNIIDTQVLNNFEESLHTEDFHDTPKKSKRSGSPILSCPKAKKRKKFEIPYSQKLPKPEVKKEIINKNTNDNKIAFNDNYKKIKKYNLRDLEKITKNVNTTTDPYLLQLSFDNLLQFEFRDTRNGLSHGNMTIDLLKELFLNSVNQKLIPKGWLENHLKLILWKLISYEIKYNSVVVCNARNVVEQLKYRYDTELYNARRPALRKILEKDDVASKTIVLCVAGIYVDGVNEIRATTTDNLELLLTDGWYCVRASIDKMLAQHVCAGRIGVGTKIVTTGAELVNCEQGISPWEDTSAVRLKIFGNSTRRARWDARLGYHGNAAILSHLSSVMLDGGKVSKLRVFVTRVYPAMYVEKFEDGSTVTRSERLEQLYQMKNEADRQAVMEKIYEEVEKEFSGQESQDSEGPSDLSIKRACLDSGSQIAKVMKRSRAAEFRAELTSSQTRLLEAHTSKRRERLLEDIQKRVREKIENAGVCVNRNVVALFKIRVAGVRERSGVEVTKGMMSIWKPTDAVLEIIKEGTWIDVMNVVPTAIRYSEIQLSAGRQSVFSISKYSEPEELKPYTKLLIRNCFTINDLSHNPSMATDYNEVDTVGFIFLIDPPYQEFDTSKQPFQNVFLSDPDKNMICINFWGGLKKFGFQNVLDTGQIVFCANLQKRAGNTRKSIPQYRVTEFSLFTKTPKNDIARNMVDDLNKKFSSLDRRKFCNDCVALKNNYSILKYNNENISPYRFNNSDFNLSKHKIFIDSPLARQKMEDNFNLTGLDFESTFKQTDTQNLSEKMLLRKKQVDEKIARLKMYGEPPPLSCIHIVNRSKNASMSYKSPLISRDNDSKCIQKSKSENPLHSNSDSSDRQETSEKGANFNNPDMCSPVILNRTYVKSVNPVKIDFDVEDLNESGVDHFAEEFDGSPPLSLD